MVSVYLEFRKVLLNTLFFYIVFLFNKYTRTLGIKANASPLIPGNWVNGEYKGINNFETRTVARKDFRDKRLNKIGTRIMNITLLLSSFTYSRVCHFH